MEKYIVQITDEALEDMEAIYHHIADVLHSRINAAGQYDRIADEIMSLSTFAERCRRMDELPDGLKELRRMPVDHYSVFYLIRDNRVIVTDVLYGASDIERRLKERHLQ